MKTLALAVTMTLLSGCALFQNERERCGSLLDAAADDLDATQWRGFAGAMSHGKATALLVHGRVQQALERFPNCIEAGRRAQFYIAESRAGR
jgi:hypothetical protein